MQKTLIALGMMLGTSFSLVTAAEAGSRKDWVCWMTPSGHNDCANLPEPYKVRDVPMKPHKHPGLNQPCRHCAVGFKLTHDNIDDLGRYIDNSKMRRFHDATLYGSKYRTPRD